jgi:large conductance mechanosensitive channel
MRNMLKEFREFISKGNVVMIAVGLVLALYFQAIVDAATAIALLSQIRDLLAERQP